MIWLILSGSAWRNTRGLWVAILALAVAAGVPAAAGGQNPRQASVRLLTQTPIQAVTQAVAQARDRAPIPAALNPASSSLVADSDYVAPNCVPTFGPGTTYDLCSLGAVRSRHLVVLLGDSHAWMWIPGMVEAATELDFRLVPITKPGCALWALYEN